MKYTSFYLVCLCLFQAILCEELLQINQPFKPFISVLSKESIKSFTENTRKFLSFVENEEKFVSDAEEKLRDVKVAVKCFYVDDFNLYNIKSLDKNPLDEKPYYTTNLNGTNIFYKFCEDMKETEGCNSQKGQVKAGKGEKECNSLTDRIGAGNHWDLLDGKIEIKLKQKEGSKNVVKYILECDNVTNLTNTTPIASKSHYIHNETDNSTDVLLYFRTVEACPTMNFYIFWKFLMDFKLIFGVILIVAGLFECILGKKLMKITAFILSCAAVVIVATVFFMEFIVPPGAAYWIIWIILFISSCIGIYLGYVVAKYDDKVLSLLVGGVTGFFLGEFLYNLFGYAISLKPLLVNILFVVVSIIVLVIVALILRNVIIIFCTSFIGSYAAIRGISFFAGGFPSEFTVMDIISAGEEDQFKELLNYKVYLYIVSIIVLTGIGIFVQYKINSDDKFKDSDDVDEDLVDKN